jgi:hypothetical protein
VTLLEAGTRKEDIAMLRTEIRAAKANEQLAVRTLEREQELTTKGGGWADVAVEFQWLCGLLVIVLIIASLRFKKKLL